MTNQIAVAQCHKRQAATATQIEDSLLATAMLERAGQTANWRGTATELLEELGTFVGKKVRSAPGWPKSPALMTNELRRIALQLRSNGLFVTFERTKISRTIHVSNTAESSPASSPLSG